MSFMLSIFKISRAGATAAGLMLTLSACGGGPGEDMRAVGEGGEIPVIINNTAPTVAVPAGSTKIIGAHGLTLARLHATQIQLTNGAEASNGAVTIADGSSIFMGSQGFINGVQASPIGSIRELHTNGSYQSATMYSGGISDPDNGVFYGITQGVYGKEANYGPITAAGYFQYDGEGRALYQNSPGSQPITLTDGTAQVDINFVTNKVDVALTNLTTNGAPFDSVFVVDMDLVGNRYSGGALGTRLNGTFVNVTGSNSQSAATGVILGDNDPQGLPLETGGVIYARGDSGAIGAVFVAK